MHGTIALFLSFLIFAIGCGTSVGDSDRIAADPSAAIDELNAEPTGNDPDSKPSQGEIVRSTDVDPPSTSSGDSVQLISFDDLNIGMPVDTKFRPIMLQANNGRVNELFGNRVTVAGYMDPTDTMQGVTEFILLRNLDCKFGPGGQADHLVRVYLASDITTSFTDKVVYVEGELVLNPFPEDPQEPLTYSIYDLTNAKVSTRRPSRAR